MLPLDPQAQNSAPVPQGLGPLGLGPVGLGPVGQVRIYLGSAHRFIWPVHLAGWLELGWVTEPGANGPGVAPRATPVATRTSSKTRRSNKEKNLIDVNPMEANPTNESPVGASPSGVNPVGASSATADEPLPVLLTDFLEPSVPTND